jgi:protein SCO1
VPAIDWTKFFSSRCGHGRDTSGDSRHRSNLGGEDGGWLAVVCLLACALTPAPVTATASQALPQLDRVMLVQPPRAVTDFELTDQDGAVYRSTQLRGAPTLLFFGYAHCPDVCPAALAKLKLVHEREDLHGIRVVFVTVDGARDTSATLKAYLARLSPDFIGLTGDPNVVRGIAEGFHVSFFNDQPGADAGYKVQHSGQIYLLDADGQLRAELYDPPVDTIATLARALL